jgi:hypothetical protein
VIEIPGRILSTGAPHETAAQLVAGAFYGLTGSIELSNLTDPAQRLLVEFLLSLDGVVWRRGSHFSFNGGPGYPVSVPFGTRRVRRIWSERREDGHRDLVGYEPRAVDVMLKVRLTLLAGSDTLLRLQAQEDQRDPVLEPVRRSIARDQTDYKFTGFQFGASSLTTDGIPTAAGNLLVVCFGTDNGAFDTLVDNTSQSWTDVTAFGTVTTAGIGIGEKYADNITGNADNTITVSSTGSTNFKQIFLHEISGHQVGTALDERAAAISPNNSSHTSGDTAATDTANELLLGHMIGQGLVYTPTGSFSQIQQADGGISAERVVTATGAYAFTATTPSNQASVNLVSTWREQSGGALPRRLPLLFAG